MEGWRGEAVGEGVKAGRSSKQEMSIRPKDGVGGAKTDKE